MSNESAKKIAKAVHFTHIYYTHRATDIDTDFFCKKEIKKKGAPIGKTADYYIHENHWPFSSSIERDTYRYITRTHEE